MSKRMKHVGEVRIMIHPDYQRRGFGTKLLKAAIRLVSKKGRRRLEADTITTNVTVRKMVQKAVFKLKDVRKMRIRKNDQYLDEALMAMILK